MRLLNTKTFRLEEFFGRIPPPYVILSHTWSLDGKEVLYQDVLAGQLDSADTRPAKVSGCCEVARKDGFNYVWIDTLCINKDSSTELQEAITSMFRWYREAHICYVFLSDVPAGDDPHDPRSAFFSSRWFQRGWTLQELLAPLHVCFYDSSWQGLGTKGDLCDTIEMITGIPISFLLGIKELDDASVAQRMSWAAGRITKRKEDMAYCLLGIFNVFMPMIYGEGSYAFRRLQYQIMDSTGDDSVLAWGLSPEGPAVGDSLAPTLGGILAAGPSEFANSTRIISKRRHRLRREAGNLSLHLSVHKSLNGEVFGLLNCGLQSDPGKVVGIPLAVSGAQSGEYVRPQGRKAALFAEPGPEIPVELVRIQLDGESKSQTAPSHWFYIRNSVRNLGLIEVEPVSFWRRERSLIEATSEEKVDGDVQRILARFRDEKTASLDFVVVLEVRATDSGMETERHVMVASRHDTLRNIKQRWGEIRPKALKKEIANNGTSHLHVKLEPGAEQETIVTLRVPSSLSSATVTTNVTLELESLRLGRELQALNAIDKEMASEEKNLDQKRQQLQHTLGAAAVDLASIKEQIKSLETAKRLLAKEIEADTGLMASLDAQEKYMQGRRYELSEQRLRVTQLLDKPEAIGLGVRETDSDSKFDLFLPHFAAAYGHVDLLRLLLDAGADPNLPDYSDHTPLGLACFYGNLFAAGLLLDRGADAATQNSRGETALHYASCNGNETVVRLLLDRDADVATQDSKGLTALHLASTKGHIGVVQLLIDRGADIMAKTISGNTALEIATRNGHDAVVAHLREWERRGRAGARKSVKVEPPPTGLESHSDDEPHTTRRSRSQHSSEGYNGAREPTNEYIPRFPRPHESTNNELPRPRSPFEPTDHEDIFGLPRPRKSTNDGDIFQRPLDSTDLEGIFRGPLESTGQDDSLRFQGRREPKAFKKGLRKLFG